MNSPTKLKQGGGLTAMPWADCHRSRISDISPASGKKTPDALRLLGAYTYTRQSFFGSQPNIIHAIGWEKEPG